MYPFKHHCWHTLATRLNCDSA